VYTYAHSVSASRVWPSGYVSPALTGTFAIGSARAPLAPSAAACAGRADFPAGTTAFGPSLLRIAISFPGKSAVRLRPEWTVRLWLTSVGVMMLAWLAGLAWATIWLIGLALS
jgi:hypothetical protein